MFYKLILFGFLIHDAAATSGLWVIPEELSSLLSVAYSNIPPIKKGTDSRVGFGFAFGNHADFQVMLELGPQSNTGKIGEAFSGNNAKRQVLQSDLPTKSNGKINPGEFLKKWAEKMKQNPAENFYEDGHLREQKPGEVPNLEDSLVELEKNENGQYEIKQPLPENMSKEVLNSLKKLYIADKQEKEKNEVKSEKKIVPDIKEKRRSPLEVKKITQDLSNVDLD